MAGEPHTWHDGLIADCWADFNDHFRAFEIPYFQRYVERGGGPARDVACGAGRVLILCCSPGSTPSAATSQRR